MSEVSQALNEISKSIDVLSNTIALSIFFLLLFGITRK